MRKLAKTFGIPAVIVFAVLSAGYGLLMLSKSRSFQLFGGLTDRVHTSQKVVALTFDDAPSEYTPTVLETLRKAGIKATFLR